MPIVHPAERPTTPIDQIAAVSSVPDDNKPTRKGWWQRKLSGE